jgi:formylglycine-generating enzyme required for sulfatase activity
MSTAGRECPYVGLVPFSVDDWPWFFGRDADREIITANLQAARLTLFYGPSGVGKSSVLRAGVEHHLREQSRREVRMGRRPEFVIVEFSSWRDDPLAGLARAIQQAVADVLPDQADTVDSRLARVSDPAETADRRSPGDLETCGPPGGSVGRPATTLERPATTPVAWDGRSLADLLQAWTERTGADLLLVLDQFEEYFLYHGNEDGEGTFAIEFPRAVNRPDLRANFLISIREDSLAKLDRFQGRIPRLFDNYLRIEHLDRDSARQAVVRPLDKYNELLKLSAAGAAESGSALQGREDSSGSMDPPAGKPGSGEPGYGAVAMDPELVEAVLDDVQTGKAWIGRRGRGGTDEDDTPAAGEQRIEAPFLQLVLTRLWDEERRQGSHRLRHATYTALGRAGKIVRRHLDRQMNVLSWREKAIAAQVFDRLVTPSGTKIAMTAEDLAKKARVPPAQVTAVLDKLCSSGSRILRATAAPGGDDQPPRYEIFHDVLAGALLDWLQRFEEGRRRTRLWTRAALCLLLALVAFGYWGWQKLDEFNRISRMVQLLSQVNADQFMRLCDNELSRSRDYSAFMLDQVVQAAPAPLESDDRRVLSGKRRADAAIALFRLGKPEVGLRALQVTQDPESLTQFVHRCKERGTQASGLWDSLQMAQDESTRYGLLLALGEFRREELPPEAGSQWMETLSDWYASDPSSAIHSASGWLLWQWGEMDRLKAVDRQPLPYDREREWFVEEVKYDDGAEPKAEYFTFVVFPPGEFQMGSPDTEPRMSKDEVAHPVRLSRRFAICDREVTAAQVMRWANARKGESDQTDELREANAGKDWANHPAVYVSWDDAVEYCRWLTDQAKRRQCYVQAGKAEPAGPGEDASLPEWRFDPNQDGFRLPTEAEWECACRAGTTTAFSFGSDETWLSKYARYGQGFSGTIPTAACGTLRPNRRGLSDMHGNVFEWCADWYDEQYYANSPAEDPRGAASGAFRVFRGGGWNGDASDCRAAGRDRGEPSLRCDYLGFRLARSVSSFEAAR